MKLKFVIICILLLPVLSAAHAQDNWELRRNENGITIYSQRQEKIVKLHLLTEFDATPATLEAELKNISNYTNWVYGNKRSGIIKKVGEHDIIYFTEAHLPWPIQ